MDNITLSSPPQKTYRFSPNHHFPVFLMGTAFIVMGYQYMVFLIPLGIILILSQASKIKLEVLALSDNQTEIKYSPLAKIKIIPHSKIKKITNKNNLVHIDYVDKGQFKKVKIPLNFFDIKDRREIRNYYNALQEKITS